MKQQQPKWRILITLLVVVSSVLSLVGYAFSGLLPWSSFWSAIRNVTTIALLTWILWEGFRKSAWKWKVFRGWLVQVPDITGEWTGQLQPNYTDPDNGERIGPLDCKLTVNQKFTSVHVGLAVGSGSSQSHSIAAAFVCDEDAGRNRLVYSYQNEASRNDPKLDDHCGTAFLDIHGDPPNIMRGFYLNDRNQQGKGTMTFSRVRPDDGTTGHAIPG